MAEQGATGKRVAKVGGLVGAGAVGGASTSDAKWPDHLITVAQNVLDKHGLVVLLVLVLVPSGLGLVAFLLRHTLDRSKAEIERLVDERNRLYDHVMIKRPTTTSTPKLPKPKKSTGR